MSAFAEAAIRLTKRACNAVLKTGAYTFDIFSSPVRLCWCDARETHKQTGSIGKAMGVVGIDLMIPLMGALLGSTVVLAKNSAHLQAGPVEWALIPGLALAVGLYRSLTANTFRAAGSGLVGNGKNTGSYRIFPLGNKLSKNPVFRLG